MSVIEKWVQFLCADGVRPIDCADAPDIAAWLQRDFSEARVQHLSMALFYARVDARYVLLRLIAEKCDFTNVEDCAKSKLLYIMAREFIDAFEIEDFTLCLTKDLPEPLKDVNVVQKAVGFAENDPETERCLRTLLSANGEL